MNFSISKIAQLYNERDHAWFDIYRVSGITSEHVEVAVPREDRDPGILRKRLLQRGARVPTLDRCRQELIAASEADARVINRASRAGWRDDGQCFVGHGFVAGIDDGSVIPPLASGSSAVGNIGVRGTLNAWKLLIEVAKYSTTMIVALAAAFAAPLLSLLQRPPFGLVFVGPSRSGKSTAQLVAASAIGFGEEEHLPSLNTTPAGLLETGQLFNDHMLPINEVGTAKGKKSDTHEVVRVSTYALTGGNDTTRHSSWGQAQGTRGSFKVLPILSSERSPDEWAERGGETREVGETARLIGLPVLHGDRTTVFDRPPALQAEHYEDWASRQFGDLRVGLPQHHGEAIRVYSSSLVARREKVSVQAAEDIEEFRTSLAKISNSPIKSDIVSKFGVLYAGGMAAIDADVLPLDDALLFKAVTRACRAAIKSLPNPRLDLIADLQRTKSFLEGAGMVDADEASTTQKRAMELADGYFSQDKREMGRTYVVRAAYFVKLFKSRPRAIRVFEWMDEEGYLRHQRDRKAGDSLEWAQSQVMWPNHQRVRSFVFYFPTDLNALDIDG